MKAVFTRAALADLEEILAYTAVNYPFLCPSVERRIRTIPHRLETWPESGRLVANTDKVRVVAVLRFPFKIFYRIGADRIEILHIHHAARRPWMR